MNVSEFWADEAEKFISGMNESVQSSSNQWHELGVVNILLAAEKDILILSEEAARSELFGYWAGLGIDLAAVDIFPVKNADHFDSITQAILLDEGNRAVCKDHFREGEGAGLFCFGYSEWEERLSDEVGAALMGSRSGINKLVNSKAFIKELCIELSVPTPMGEICSSVDRLLEVSERLFDRFDSLIIKEPYGSSGKGMIMVRDTGRIRKMAAKFNNRFLAERRSPVWIVEGWYEGKVASYNSQYLIFPSGEVQFMGHSEQALRNHVYEGNIISRDWHTETDDLLSTQQRRIAGELAKLGYYGLVGIDSVVCRDGAIFPIIEVNGRMNMSTYAFAMLELLHLSCYSFMKSYTIPLTVIMSLGEFIQHLGSELFYERRDNRGIIVLGFAPKMDISPGIIRIILLYCGQSFTEALHLREITEVKLKGL